MKRPKILLVTKDRRTYRVFYEQIADFFQDSVQMIDAQENGAVDDADLILVSSSRLVKDGDFPPEKLLVARRAVNIGKLEELIALPPGTKCLVINNMLETALETMELLKNLGFDFQMVPYYPGMNQLIKGIKVAITPAGLELVPKGMEKVIDIGIRPIDFSTMVEMAVRLKIGIERANLYTARYIKEIVSLSRRLSHTLHHVNKLNHQLDAILNTVHDGIIATDCSGKIIQVNKAARKILGVSLSDAEMIGKPANEIFPKLTFIQNREEMNENAVYTINGIHLVVNQTPIEIGREKAGVVTAFQDVTKIQQLEQDLRKELQAKGLSARYSVAHIVGNSARIQETLRILQKIAKTDQTVLILGENGTGKELFAHSIHDLSPRRNGPFLPVNFAGLPESLAESELFGYEEGAFTGAKKGGKPGLFELAHNGTIFLDEIGDASPALQALLLRVLQEKQVMRIGGRRMIPINVRVIAATNKDLKKMVEEGKFRQDLFYRLFVLPLRVPPLRERKEDIPLLVDHFLKEFCTAKVYIADEVMEKLVAYHWPGNIRELISVIQYMTSVMEGNRITLADLPEQFKEGEEPPRCFDEDIIDMLEKEGELIDFYIILSCLELAKKNRESIGRGKIVQFSQEKGVPLTDQQVRNRMNVLRALGLIHSGTRGQGSRITEAGLFALKLIRNKSFSVYGFQEDGKTGDW